MPLWDAVTSLPAHQQYLCAVALLIALGFEFVNGFHDTANAVTTVIYTRTLGPTAAVLYSAVMNFLGTLLTVVIGSGAVAFTIVHLLPVNLLIDADSNTALVSVLSLLLAGLTWNLLTWYLGIPVSSSHTLIGAILGVGLANSLLAGRGVAGVNWGKAGEVGLALLVSPLVGFAAAAALLLVMKRVVREPRLYEPPKDGDRPPGWVRGVLIATCGGVSFAHGSNDGQKGMGLILLVLIGFMPGHYALDTHRHGQAAKAFEAAAATRAELTAGGRELSPELAAAFDRIDADLGGRKDGREVPEDRRWELRKALYMVTMAADDPGLPADVRAKLAKPQAAMRRLIEFIPLWVLVAVATALAVGTTIGYKRVVVTVAEKIGKAHLTYAQGAAAEAVAAVTIMLTDVAHMPVSTTHVLSSGVAGTMVANGSGVQPATIRKIALAWALTLPAAMLLAAGLFTVGQWLAG